MTNETPAPPAMAAEAVDWLWFGVDKAGEVHVSFGRWQSHECQHRYKFADPQATEHDHLEAEAVAWRIRVNENGRIWFVYTEVLPYSPDDHIKVLAEPEPLFASPPKPDKGVVEALREALIRAERKLTAYVGVCNGDKELTDAVLPMCREALARLSSKGRAE